MPLWNPSGKSFSDRLKDRLQSFTNARFEDYRGQLTNDLARGVAVVAGLLVLWSLVLVVLLFVGLMLAFLLAWALRPWLGDLAYVGGFGLVALAMAGLAWRFLRQRLQLIELPVYRLLLQVLRQPEPPTPSSDKEELDSLD